MRIVDTCITHPDGSFTDQSGNRLTFDEAFLAKEYRTPDGKDMFDHAYEAGVRWSLRRERMILMAIIGPRLESDCNDLVNGKVG